MSSRYEDIADRLDGIVADLDELAFDELREAAERGETGRPASDKQLTSARRSVEKAAHLLRSAVTRTD
jgi:exonuclease VII small subunit